MSYERTAIQGIRIAFVLRASNVQPHSQLLLIPLAYLRYYDRHGPDYIESQVILEGPSHFFRVEDYFTSTELRRFLDVLAATHRDEPSSATLLGVEGLFSIELRMRSDMNDATFTGQMPRVSVEDIIRLKDPWFRSPRDAIFLTQVFAFAIPVGDLYEPMKQLQELVAVIDRHGAPA